MKILVILLALLGANAVLASEENYYFEDPAQRQLFLQLTEELRCPMCQNQNIADSDAMIAHDLRRKVYQLLQQGKSREEVLEFMKTRYGDFVSYTPPVTPATLWLWLLPVLFVLSAAVFVVKTRKKQPQCVDVNQLKEAERLLESDK
jgi:cytochrome c-type biogenesis protein CcmH